MAAVLELHYNIHGFAVTRERKHLNDIGCIANFLVTGPAELLDEIQEC